jgi:hypothetical protein
MILSESHFVQRSFMFQEARGVLEMLLAVYASQLQGPRFLFRSRKGSIRWARSCDDQHGGRNLVSMKTQEDAAENGFIRGSPSIKLGKEALMRSAIPSFGVS